MNKLWAMGVSLVLGLAGLVRAAEVADPMDLVPAKAIGFLRINNLDAGVQGLTRLVAVADAVAAQTAGEKARELVGELLGGVSLTGLDTAGTHLVVAFISPQAAQKAAAMMMMGATAGPRGRQPAPAQTQADEDMPLALVVQVKDLEQFRQALGAGASVTTEGDWQVLSTRKRQIDFDAMEKDKQEKPGEKVKVRYKTTTQTAYLQARGPYAIYTTSPVAKACFGPDMAPLGAKLAPADVQLLRSADVALYVNVESVVEIYRPMLGMLQGLVVPMASMAVGGGLPMEGAGQEAQGNAEQMKRVAALGKVLPRIINPVFQFIYDAKALTMGAKFEPDGVRAATRLTLKPGSPTGAGLALHPPGPIESMTLLPAQGSLYVGADFRGKLLLDGIRELFAEGLADLLAGPENQSAKVMEMLEKLSACEPRELSLMLGGGKAVQLLRVDKPEGLAAVTTPEMLQQAAGSMPGMKVDVKPKAETYQGVPIDVITVTIDAEAAARAQGEEMAEFKQAVLKRLLDVFAGGQTVTTRTACVGPWALKVVSPDAQLMHQTIEAVKAGKGPLADNAVYQAMRKRLPAKTNVIVLVSLPRAAQGMLSVIAETPLGAMLPVQAPKALVLDDSLTAFGLTLGAESIQCDAFLPDEQIAGLKKLVEAVQGGGQPAQAGEEEE